jgi:hypothetical protein
MGRKRRRTVLGSAMLPTCTILSRNTAKIAIVNSARRPSSYNNWSDPTDV